MRREPAAFILAACIMLGGGTAAAAAEPMPAPPASPLPETPAELLPGLTSMPEDVAQKPYLPKPSAKPAPQAQDVTFALRPAPKGFRGLLWGAAISEGKTQLGLVPVTHPLPLRDTFQRQDELLKLGMADLRTVAYYFRKGRFNGVGITFEGEANFFLIKDHLIELYGPGRQLGDRYGWTWADCNIELRLHEGAGELRYTYEP